MTPWSGPGCRPPAQTSEGENAYAEQKLVAGGDHARELGLGHVVAEDLAPGSGHPRGPGHRHHPPEVACGSGSRWGCGGIPCRQSAENTGLCHHRGQPTIHTSVAEVPATDRIAGESLWKSRCHCTTWGHDGIAFAAAAASEDQDRSPGDENLSCLHTNSLRTGTQYKHGPCRKSWTTEKPCLMGYSGRWFRKLSAGIKGRNVVVEHYVLIRK